MKRVLKGLLGIVNLAAGALVAAWVASLSVRYQMARQTNPLDSLGHDYLSPLIGLVAGLIVLGGAAWIEGRLIRCNGRDILRASFVAILLLIFLPMIIPYPSFPLDDKLTSATITKHYINPLWNWRDSENTNPSSLEVTAIVTNTQELAQIARGTRIIWNSLFPVNSMEGHPRYRMTVTYQNGSSEEFSFTRTEWSGSAFTPEKLVETIETIISNQAFQAIGDPGPPQPES